MWTRYTGSVRKKVKHMLCTATAATSSRPGGGGILYVDRDHHGIAHVESRALGVVYIIVLSSAP